MILINHTHLLNKTNARGDIMSPMTCNEALHLLHRAADSIPVVLLTECETVRAMAARAAACGLRTLLGSAADWQCLLDRERATALVIDPRIRLPSYLATMYEERVALAKNELMSWAEPPLWLDIAAPGGQLFSHIRGELQPWWLLQAGRALDAELLRIRLTALQGSGQTRVLRSKYSIRLATLADLGALRVIHKTACAEAGHAVDVRRDEQHLRAGLQHGLTWVGEDGDGSILGALMLAAADDREFCHGPCLQSLHIRVLEGTPNGLFDDLILQAKDAAVASQMPLKIYIEHLPETVKIIARAMEWKSFTQMGAALRFDPVDPQPARASTRRRRAANDAVPVNGGSPGEPVHV